MPYVAREDGERFIIPSYRDVLSAKKKSLLKREILLLATNYGEYITLHRKNADQYEVAFSSEPGCLLGETIWHHFKRPRNLIYCEAIPNTAEAVLVIVKSGSVYLDGSFPIDSIPEELVIFKTQQINFDIYVYGNVPLSQSPEIGKFTFDSNLVKSFTVLDKAVFPTLSPVKSFQLQLVEAVLKAQGIGTFPIKPLLGAIVGLGLLWMGWTYLTSHKQQLPSVIIGTTNPYQAYINALSSPNPAVQIDKIVNTIILFSTVPGWYVDSAEYSNGKFLASMKSLGARTNVLLEWARKNHVGIDVTSAGFNANVITYFLNRQPPTQIYYIDDVIADLTDRLSYIIPGNVLKLGTYINRGKFTAVEVSINFNKISTTTLNFIGEQLKSLPVILSKASFTFSQGAISGSIVIEILGN